jgi:two-component system, response regulator PdtaR
MNSSKLNELVSPEPWYKLSAPSRGRPQLTFAREDSAGLNTLAGPPARILVVEDDFLVAAGIERALSDARFDVAGVAASADEAVELAESQKPSLIVMDVRLAGERDGIHAAVEIFQKLGIRSIFATAHYDPRSIERAKPAMPLSWIQKPYSMVSLVNAVRDALRELNP